MFYLKIKFGENLIMKNRFLIVFLLTMSQMLLSAQNVDDYLDNYLGKNKDGYVQPVSGIDGNVQFRINHRTKRSTAIFMSK